MSGDARLIKESSLGWRLIVCLVLIAFTLQSFVTQSHIHNRASAAATKVLTHSPSKAPLDDNPLDCPFCQAVAHDGPFFLPAAPLLALSVAYIELCATTFRFHNFWDAPAYIWQSRAPPHH
jgi:hypothetical protein